MADEYFGTGLDVAGGPEHQASAGTSTPDPVRTAGSVAEAEAGVRGWLKLHAPAPGGQFASGVHAIRAEAVYRHGLSILCPELAAFLKAHAVLTQVDATAEERLEALEEMESEAQAFTDAMRDRWAR
jgi:hypothetical protein